MRFFFQVRDGSGSYDEIGKDLPDIAAARLEVERLAIVELAERPSTIWRGGGWSIDVIDDEGMLLFALHLFSSITPKAYAASRVRVLSEATTR